MVDNHATIDDVNTKIDAAISKMKVWIFAGAFSIVTTFGGGAITFYMQTSKAIEMSSENRGTLNDRFWFVVLTTRQMEQVQDELKKNNPDFDPILRVERIK